eukprot:3932745-Amphidinium_carterae.1
MLPLKEIDYIGNSCAKARQGNKPCHRLGTRGLASCKRQDALVFRWCRFRNLDAMPERSCTF